jgi:hypothetical protein
MSEPITDPIDNTAELATLRRVRDELLQAKHVQKSRITELESQVLQLTEARDNALETVRALTIDRPLRQLAEEMSQAPNLWLREFMADFSVEVGIDGSLTIQSKDGKQVSFDDGKPVQASASDLRKFLISPNKTVSAERRKDFSTITTVSRASGTIGPHIISPSSSNEGTKPLQPHFGLR